MAKKKYELVTPPHVHDDNVEHKAGAVIEDERNLIEMFPNKFKIADSAAKPTMGKKLASAADQRRTMSAPTAPQPVDPEVEKAERAKARKAEKVAAAAAVEDELASAEEPPELSRPAPASEGENVTDQFEDAAKNDLSVWQSEEGYTLKDGDVVVNKEPVKSKTAVKRIIIGHLKAE